MLSLSPLQFGVIERKASHFEVGSKVKRGHSPVSTRLIVNTPPLSSGQLLKGILTDPPPV